MDQSPRVERKLAAILAADVVGYSRLMGLDEAGTLARLKSLRRQFIEPRIAEHHGRIVKLMGDGALVEFPSVVDAVACAVEIQRVTTERSAEMPEDQRIAFRIGVNLGDIIIDGDDIYGEGVNIAARLEALSEPGGIIVSGTVYEHAHNKLDVAFESLGAQNLKNIAEPVMVYRVLLDGSAAMAKKPRSRRWIVPAATALLLVLIVAAAAALWPLLTEGPTDTGAAPDKPSIAVLPFGNLGGETEQAYFAEGLTDDLITDLSKISGLLVIARNSTAAYRDPSVDVREVAEQLGVRYVLEGSVRRSGDSVRINVQLIDGSTGGNVWAERYDRAYAEIFMLQDEVIRRIVEALSVRLTASEQSQIARLPTRNLEAYDFYMRAEQKVYDLNDRSLAEALSLYERAIALDPQFAEAHAGYARALVDVFGFAYDNLMMSVVARQQAYDAAGRALEINPNTPRAYAVLGILQMFDGKHDEAIASVEKALALDPSSADAELNRAIILSYAGRQEDALAAMERVLRLNPKPPTQVYEYYASVLLMLRRYGEIVQLLGGYDVEQLGEVGLEALAVAYQRVGRTKDVEQITNLILKRSPSFNLATNRVVLATFQLKEDAEYYLGILRDIGIPDWPYGYQPPADSRLDGAAIRTLAIDKTWVGKQITGEPFVMQMSGKGDYAQRGPQGMVIGKVTFEGDLMCTQSPAAVLGRRFCGPLFRNPDGTAEKQDEYVYPDPATVRFFSVAP